MNKSDDKWAKAHQEIDEFYKEVINLVLPEARWSENSMFGGEGPPPTFKSKLSKERLLVKSPYEYKGKNNFLHFTTLNGLMAILNSGFLRMSEFGNLIDKHELIYGAKVFEGADIFNFSEDKLMQLKENLFCFSMSQFSEATLKNQFMWEAYSSKGKGACVQFKFTRPYPFSFLIGKILYGTKKLDTVRKLKNAAIGFHETSRIFPNDFLELILELQSLHKAKKYNSEKEVRLLFRQDKEKYNKHSYQTIYQDVNNNNEVKYFNKIYLKGRNEILKEVKEKNLGIDEKTLFSIFPQVEITGITLGSSLEVQVKLELRELLNEIKQRNNYSYKISHMNQEEEVMLFR